MLDARENKYYIFPQINRLLINELVSNVRPETQWSYHGQEK